MADFQRAVPKPDQSCPICGARLAAGALYCERCGTDLSRAGMVLSSVVRPVSRRRGSMRALLRALRLPLAVTVGIVVLLVAASNVPAVGGRLPVLRSVADPVGEIVETAWAWGMDLISTAQKAARPTPRRTAPAVPQKGSPAVPRKPSPAAPEKTSPLHPPETAASSPEKAARGAGFYLIVKSAPAGAGVYVNGQRIGATPLTVTLQPGSYRVRLTREGYFSVTRIVEVGKGGTELAVRLKPSTPGKPPAAASPEPSSPPPASPPPAPPQPSAGLQVGAAAPGFSLKDRFGVIHRLSDLSGRKVALLFVWDLDQTGKQAVRTLVARRGAREAVVVYLRPDRPALRRFLAAESITVPVLFGNASVAAAYRVPQGVPMLYVLSESGQIISRQVARQ